MLAETAPEAAAGRPVTRWTARAALAGAGLWVALAAPALADDDANDPLEPFNRMIFSFNELIDLMLLEPASIVYGHLPSPVRTGVRNVLDNLRAPVVFANDAMQGEGDRAGVTLARFMINSTVGMLGLFDMASEFGYPKHHEDFGQTLARWGTGEGPYLVLPILGPSNARDTTGILVDGFALDPMAYVAPTDVRIGRAATDGVDTRYRYDPAIRDLRENSIDRYATFRTVYRQRRAAEIANGATPTNEAYEDIFNEGVDPEPTPAP
ncbi:MAG TPA: VacJ family lipoprotein [Geminicoccaceae bacterium]|nr:VacJ family lipoprotein [Geminicoccus sp.]HMU53110.1 VacJ family lipoprotein [Geminicoccaceae bacterium]